MRLRLSVLNWLLFASLFTLATCGPIPGVDGGTGGGTAENDAGATGGGGGTDDAGFDAGVVCEVTACPAPSGPCVEAFCNSSNACDERPLADGTVLATQQDGDCRSAVCLSGQSSSQADD